MSEKWTAHITVSGGNPDGWEHYVVNVLASNDEAALEGIRSVTDHLVADHPVEFRTRPTASREWNFEEDAAAHKGFSRFSLKVDLDAAALEQTEIEIK